MYFVDDHKGHTRRRDLLHLNKVEEFHYWLQLQGYQDLPLKQYEVIRMVHPEAPPGNMLIVWSKQDAKEHATIQGPSYFAYLEWAKWDKRQEELQSEVLRSCGQDDGMAGASYINPTLTEAEWRSIVQEAEERMDPHVDFVDDVMDPDLDRSDDIDDRAPWED